MMVWSRSVVEPRIDEEIGAEVFVELKGYGVFPFQFGAAIGGVAIDAHSPFNHL